MALQVDIARMLANKAGEHLAEAKLLSKNKETLKESEECIQAVILFQSAMEAVITEEIENEYLLKQIKKENEDLYSKHKSLSFKNKWEKTFEILNIKQRASLKEYLRFYSRYRVPITHPKSRYISLEDYHFVEVEKGIKNGWEAMQILFKTLEKNSTGWTTFEKEVGLKK